MISFNTWGGLISAPYFLVVKCSCTMYLMRAALFFALLSTGTLHAAQEAASLRASTPADQRMVTDPASVPAVSATFLKDSDMVIGVSIDGAAKAYWLPMVIWVHRVRDQIGGTPILVTWCSMCNTGLVFRPEADGKELTFSVPGLRGGNLVLRDEQTGSQWQQATGEAFAGPLKGTHLPLLPFQIASWRTWRARHPDTLAMVPDPRDQPRYESMDQRISEPIWEMQPAPMALKLDARLPPHTMILGVESGNGSAYPIDGVKDEGIINDQVGTLPLLIVYTASEDTVTAFTRRIGQQVLTFDSVGSTGMTDTETSSAWNADGECLSGKLKGKRLEPVILEPAFWFAWAEFHPDTAVYSPFSK